MHNTPQPRIALLIDADNAPAEKVDDILTELSTLGEISIRRIYGNWTKPHLSGWQSKLLDYALRPMQQFDYAKGKNATDMAMTVDAMELLYTERPNAFGIVSSGVCERLLAVFVSGIVGRAAGDAQCRRKHKLCSANR